MDIEKWIDLLERNMENDINRLLVCYMNKVDNIEDLNESEIYDMSIMFYEMISNKYVIEG